MPNNKACIYTCIVGEYDNIIEYNNCFSGFDMICFSDKPFKSNTWQWRPMPKETDVLSNVKKARYIKINAHKILSEYNASIWIDGCEKILKNPGILLKYENTIAVPTHPKRTCLYKEAEMCKKCLKDFDEVMFKQMWKYKNCGFPSNYGLAETNILIRKHNEPECVRFMNDWWIEVLEGSHRDQLSFDYIRWKQNANVFFLEKGFGRDSEFFYRMPHNK